MFLGDPFHSAFLGVHDDPLLHLPLLLYLVPSSSFDDSYLADHRISLQVTPKFIEAVGGSQESFFDETSDDFLDVSVIFYASVVNEAVMIRDDAV